MVKKIKLRTSFDSIFVYLTGLVKKQFCSLTSELIGKEQCKQIDVWKSVNLNLKWFQVDMIEFYCGQIAHKMFGLAKFNAKLDGNKTCCRWLGRTTTEQQ